MLKLSSKQTQSFQSLWDPTACATYTIYERNTKVLTDFSFSFTGFTLRWKYGFSWMRVLQFTIIRSGCLYIL